jgi:hypothetical protein
MSQNIVVAVMAELAVLIAMETSADLDHSSALSRATSWRISLRARAGISKINRNSDGWAPHPGMASKKSSPHLVIIISIKGVKAAPFSCSAPLATLNASTPGFMKETTHPISYLRERGV